MAPSLERMGWSVAVSSGPSAFSRLASNILDSTSAAEPSKSALGEAHDRPLRQQVGRAGSARAWRSGARPEWHGATKAEAPQAPHTTQRMARRRTEGRESGRAMAPPRVRVSPAPLGGERGFRRYKT
eukprot:CAMPEP_0206222624 /NCGR_PEP_ID=MMETSP0047_2-20121206/6055_1 /ASSEMBLY_ACC=CAM_ASM_000192 /TAXON_ID=195065 /ORGANISM="Chroomonas mesostigmatica_cf, Strain CCMP1168" /LENGTH=126 /DNA_ID=CAMNT_0053645453 /DNA_START=244 /DNA_END=620 /DNA_ORIENTATION=+